MFFLKGDRIFIDKLKMTGRLQRDSNETTTIQNKDPNMKIKNSYPKKKKNKTQSKLADQQPTNSAIVQQKQPIINAKTKLSTSKKRG